MNKHDSEQRTIWNHVAAAWESWSPTFEQAAQAVSDRLVAGARTGPRNTVLDFATGLGQPALTAAKEVGPQGRVIGVDLAPEMIKRAQLRASGTPWVQFYAGSLHELFAHEHAVFDSVLSRWGLALVEKPADVLQVMHRLLRPGGRLAIANWSSPEDVPVISLAFSTVSELLELAPAPAGPGPFALADTRPLIQDLKDLGYTGIHTETMNVPFVFESPERFTDFLRDVLPPRMQAVIADTLGTLRDPELWAEVQRRAEHFTDAQGLVLASSSTNLIFADKPE